MKTFVLLHAIDDISHRPCVQIHSAGHIHDCLISSSSLQERDDPLAAEAKFDFIFQAQLPQMFPPSIGSQMHKTIKALCKDTVLRPTSIWKTSNAIGAASPLS